MSVGATVEVRASLRTHQRPLKLPLPSDVLPVEGKGCNELPSTKASVVSGGLSPRIQSRLARRGQSRDRGKDIQIEPEERMHEPIKGSCGGKVGTRQHVRRMALGHIERGRKKDVPPSFVNSSGDFQSTILGHGRLCTCMAPVSTRSGRGSPTTCASGTTEIAISPETNRRRRTDGQHRG